MPTLLPYKFVNKDDPILKIVCADVQKGMNGLENIIFTLKYALESEKNGVGLSANQIGFPYKIFAISFEDPDSEKGKMIQEVLLNPKILWTSKREKEELEGCLSLPGVWGYVKRPIEVKLEALNENFEKKVFRAKGFLARVIQHEVDHLNGILFVERITDKSKIKISKEKPVS